MEKDKVLNKRKKESGAKYRKKKAKRDQEVAKLSGAMEKYVSIKPKPNSSTMEYESESMESNKFVSSEDESGSTDAESGNQSTIQSDDEQESKHAKQIEPNANDPNTWPDVVPDAFREEIVKSGLPPIPRPHMTYPQHKGRSFN